MNSVRDLWDISNCTNRHLMGVPKKTDRIFGEIIAENKFVENQRRGKGIELYKSNYFVYY